MKNKITIDTIAAATELAAIIKDVRGNVTITDNNGLRVSAKSLLGVLCAMEFQELWLESEADIYALIEKFVAV